MAPIAIPPEIARFDLRVMLAATVLLVACAATGHRPAAQPSRGRGFLVCDAAYLWALAD